MLTQVVAGRVYDYSHCVGQYLGGMEWPGEGFVLPVSLAVSEEDTIYVLGRGSESTGAGAPLQPRAFGARVGKFKIGPLLGDEQHVTTFGSYGEAEGQFVWPAAIALDSSENVYVTDEWLGRVSVFDRTGGFLRAWDAREMGEHGSGRPSGIAIDRDDRIYVVDRVNCRVLRYGVDGELLGSWGDRGSDPGRLDSPWGITVNDEGHLFVADHMNHRVQQFTADGGFVRSFGSCGSGQGELNRPSDVAVDPEGDVYVCDWANDRVQVFDSEGVFIATIVGDARELSLWARMTVKANPDVQKARRRVETLEPEWRFALPTGVAFDKYRSRLIVADTQRYRIQIYNKLSDYPEPQFNL